MSYFKLLHHYGVNLISTRQEIEDTPEGFFMYGINSVVNEYHSIKLSRDVKQAHNHLRKQGIFPHLAPMGFQNVRSIDGKASIIIDERVAILIRTAFEYYAEGKLNSLVEIADYFYKEGYRHPRSKNGRLHKQSISRMLNNPFYYGYFIHDGELIAHKYPRIISKELFDKVQRKLNGKTAQTGVYKKINEDYPLKTICNCTECSKKLFGAPSKGNGGTYHYYYCRTKNCNKATSTEIVHDLFKKELMELEPTTGTLNLFEEILKRIYRQKTVNDEDKRSKLLSRIEVLKKTKVEVKESFIR